MIKGLETFRSAFREYSDRKELNRHHPKTENEDTDMKKNEVNSDEASGDGASCKCDHNRGANKAVIVIGVILLLGFAFFAMYSRMNPALTESQRLIVQADELFQKEDFAGAAALDFGAPACILLGN